MAVRFLETATCYLTADDSKQTYPTMAQARAAAEAFVGNRSAAKPFPSEETYLYGPGNGEVSVMVRQDVDRSAFCKTGED